MLPGPVDVGWAIIDCTTFDIGVVAYELNMLRTKMQQRRLIESHMRASGANAFETARGKERTICIATGGYVSSVFRF